MTTDTLILLRRLFLGAAGAVCLCYAVLALLWGQPDPFGAWVPGAAGALAAVGLTAAGLAAGRARAEEAFDEGYDADNGHAYACAFWTVVAMYPIFGVLLHMELVTFPVAFAAMGTLTGAAYLLFNVVFDIRGT